MDEKDIVIEKLLARIDELEALVAELTKRLSKNSRNSSKPPSSDGLSKPPKNKNNSLRQKGKNKSGGQPGHKGETLRQITSPDKIEYHRLVNCPTCSANLKFSPSLGTIKRLVFDLPVPKIEVTEHQAEIKKCCCCHQRVIAPFPNGINAPTQYGDVLKSYSVYLQQQQFIPEDRLRQLFQDLFNVNLATATINKFSESVYDKLECFEQEMLTQLKQVPVKHLDETGFRVNGKTQWLHVVATEALTYYHISPKRKCLLEGLSGIVVHDHWKSYYKLIDVEHALCNQHHLRELKAVIEYDKETWARHVQQFFRVALRYKHHCSDEYIPKKILEQLFKLYDNFIEEGIYYHEELPIYSKENKRGRRAKRTGHNLVLRLKQYRSDVLRFLTNPLVPFTNNQAEQDLRMMKVKQKISGGFRSERGAKIFARVRGFISTTRKQGLNVFDAISQVIRGETPQLI